MVGSIDGAMVLGFVVGSNDGVDVDGANVGAAVLG